MPIDTKIQNQQFLNLLPIPSAHTTGSQNSQVPVVLAYGTCTSFYNGLGFLTKTHNVVSLLQFFKVFLSLD